MHGIYIILNLITNECYIGSAVNLKKRITQHISLLRRHKSKHIHLQRAWNKYEEANFEINFLEIIEDKSILTKREQYFIDTLKPTYNSRLIAESNLGLKDSDETKIKKKQAAKKRGQNENQKEGLRKAQQNRIGFAVTGKVKESLKLGPLSLIGKEKSKETKQKIRQSKLGELNFMFGISQEKHPSSKKVRNIETGKIYPSARQCAIELERSYVHVNNILRGLRKNSLSIEYVTSNQ